MDISHILKNWEYAPDEVNVRIIQGKDGSRKIQMRLDLGLLQMEYSGRPDGKRPHGYESLLDYYRQNLDIHRNELGSESGFSLDSNDCAALRNEAQQYYYRYLSLFHLQEYEAVERDTARNLRAFDFIKQYAADEDDRFLLEQYRPYVLMMNARSAAYRLLEKNELDVAIDRLETAIRLIRDFFRDFDRPDLADQCSEIQLLMQLVREIRSRWKNDPVSELRKKMQQAVAREDFETAAHIRDTIRQLNHQTV